MEPQPRDPGPPAGGHESRLRARQGLSSARIGEHEGTPAILTLECQELCVEAGVQRNRPGLAALGLHYRNLHRIEGKLIPPERQDLLQAHSRV